MLGLLILLFTLVPALEFYLLFTIGSEIGAGNTFLIIILTGVVGAFLAKLQGLAVLMSVQKELATGQLPGRQIVHGFIVFGGGLLLLTPGFITDALGFCMVIPGTRHLIVAAVMSYFKRGIASGNIVFMSNMKQSYQQYPPQEESLEGDVFEADFKEKE
jgi:UPF0716 protein FxsA